jgi:hypothetical protein
MRKIALFAVAAVLTGAGVEGWVASTTHARFEAPLGTSGIDLSQITMNARDLPTEEFVDYPLVFN